MFINFRIVAVVLCATLALVRADDPPTDPPADPQPSNGPNGNGRRSLQECEWTCPWRGTGKKELVEFEMGDTFTCKYADSVTCVYQKTTGVLSRNVGECPNGATPLVAGCIPGHATNGGVDAARKRSKARRTSCDIQREAMKKRHML